MHSYTFIYIIDPQVITNKLCPPVCSPLGLWDHDLYALGLQSVAGRWNWLLTGMAQSPSCDHICPDRSASSGCPLRGGDNAQLLTNVVNSFIGAHLFSWQVLIEISIRKKQGHFYSSGLTRVNVTPHVDDTISFVFAFEASSPFLTPALTHS